MNKQKKKEEIKKNEERMSLSVSDLPLGILFLAIACLMATFDSNDIVCQSKTEKAGFHYAPCTIQCTYQRKEKQKKELLFFFSFLLLNHWIF